MNTAASSNQIPPASATGVDMDDHGGIIAVATSPFSGETQTFASVKLDPVEQLRQETIHKLGLQTDLAQVMVGVMLDNLRLLDQKQQDYGSLNLTKFGSYGVLVRTNDKLERLINLSKKTDAPRVSESLADTWRDLMNYGGIGYVMQAGIWPKK